MGGFVTVQSIAMKRSVYSETEGRAQVIVKSIARLSVPMWLQSNTAPADAGAALLRRVNG